MRNLVKFAAGAVAALAISGGAAQASTWVIDYTANGLGDLPQSAVVNLVASDSLNTVNGYDVLSVTGNVDGDAIAALVNNPNQPTQSTSPDGLFYFDNVVWPGAAQQLSSPGILFTGVSGTEYNLFADDATHYQRKLMQNRWLKAAARGFYPIRSRRREPPVSPRRPDIRSPAAPPKPRRTSGPRP